MQLISDLHLHSRHSRACSKDLSIKTLEKYAKIKGVNLLGTSDFAHPEWIKELKSELTEDHTGVLLGKADKHKPPNNQQEPLPQKTPFVYGIGLYEV